MTASNATNAQLAVKYVKRTLTIGANNRWGDVWRSGGASLTCVAGEKVAEIVLSRVLGEMDALKKIRTIATMAERRKCGNCGEQACVAFVYSYDRGVRPIELMQFANGDHGYVVIGRTEDALAANAQTANGYVADAWLGKWYPFAMLDEVWPGKHPALIYRAA